MHAESERGTPPPPSRAALYLAAVAGDDAHACGTTRGHALVPDGCTERCCAQKGEWLFVARTRRYMLGIPRCPKTRPPTPHQAMLSLVDLTGRALVVWSRAPPEGGRDDNRPRRRPRHRRAAACARRPATQFGRDQPAAHPPKTSRPGTKAAPPRHHQDPNEVPPSRGSTYEAARWAPAARTSDF